MVQPGMPAQMPIPQPQMPPGQQVPQAMMQGFMAGPAVSAGPLTLASSTVAAQSPLDIFVGPSTVDASGPQQNAAQPELRQQQQRTIWSGQYLVRTSFALVYNSVSVIRFVLRVLWSLLIPAT